MSRAGRFTLIFACVGMAAPAPVGLSTARMGAMSMSTAPVGGLSPQPNMRPPFQAANWARPVGGCGTTWIGPCWGGGWNVAPFPVQNTSQSNYQSAPVPVPVAPVLVPIQPWFDHSFAMVTVELPADAELWIQGRLTKQTGPIRQFTTPTEIPGLPYTLELRARWAEAGQPVVHVQHVTVRGGDRAGLVWVRSAP